MNTVVCPGTQRTHLCMGSTRLISFSRCVYTPGQMTVESVWKTWSTLNCLVQNVSKKVLYLNEGNTTSNHVLEGKNDIDFVR